MQLNCQAELRGTEDGYLAPLTRPDWGGGNRGSPCTSPKS